MCPTAVQAFDALHETPSNWTCDATDGVGALWNAQFVPFQRSTSVR
jgi:hypothetical protein